MSDKNPKPDQAACAAKLPEPLFQRILVAVDDSQQALWATQMAGEIARTSGAKVALLHAYRVDPGYALELATPVDDLIADLRESGQELLTRLRGVIPPNVEVSEMLADGEAATQIVQAAEQWGAQLIVMGTHGRGRIAHFLLGGTADSVIRHARCPVMSVAHEPAKPVSCCAASREPASVH